MTIRYDFSQIVIDAAQADFERNRCYTDDETNQQLYYAHRFFECEECGVHHYPLSDGTEPTHCLECGCEDLFPESFEAWKEQYYDNGEMPY